MRGIQKQTFQTIVLVALLALSLELAGWYGLHQTEKTVTDFESTNLPEMSTALNLSKGVAQLAALAPYVAGSVKPFQLQTERQRLESRFSELKEVAQSLKNTVFKQDLERRLLKFRHSLSELIERIEEELFLREDLLSVQFSLTELQRRDHAPKVEDSVVPLSIFSVLDFLITQSDRSLMVPQDFLVDMFDRWSAGSNDPVTARTVENLVVQLTETRAQEHSIGRRKAYLLASLRAQSEQLAEQVVIYTTKMEQEVVKQRQRVQATVGKAYTLMLVIAGFLMWGMLHHYRFSYRMTRDLSSVTHDMLRLAEKGDTDTIHIGIQREDEIGELARAYHVFRDYALQIKEFSDRLASQKVLLETVFNHIQDGLSVFSAKGKLISWNRRFLELFNLSADEVYVGRDLGELQLLLEREPHEYRTLSNDPVDIESMNVLRHNMPLTFERRYQTGKVVEFRSQPMPDGGFVTLYGDLTERKAVEAQLHQAQRMEVLGQLTGGVAHDFNNLLAALLTNLQLLHATQGLSSKQKRYTLRSISVAEKGVILVERLLAFSRKQQLFPEAVDVNDLIAGMLDLVEYSMAPGITISTDFRAGQPVFVDPSQLENALLNLAVNSSAAMPNGGQLAFVTEHREHRGQSDNEKDCIAVITEDTGSGIPRQMQERVLEPFFTTKPAGRGSGMGLSMVYGFVKQSGGEMQIKSSPGEGTRITLLLPMAGQGETTKAKKSGQRVEPVSIPAGKKILLVEDNPEVRQAVCEQIESFGHKTVAASDAETALQYLHEQGADYSLVITDISLDGSLSGVDLKEELRESVPGIPVVMTSGLPRANLEQHYGLRPEDEFLTKPIPLPVLKRLLRNKG